MYSELGGRILYIVVSALRRSLNIDMYSYLSNGEETVSLKDFTSVLASGRYP